MLFHRNQTIIFKTRVFSFLYYPYGLSTRDHFVLSTFIIRLWFIVTLNPWNESHEFRVRSITRRLMSWIFYMDCQLECYIHHILSLTTRVVFHITLVLIIQLGLLKLFKILIKYFELYPFNFFFWNNVESRIMYANSSKITNTWSTVL